MFKIMMSALVAVAFYTNVTERGLGASLSLIIAVAAAMAAYYIYVKFEEMEAEFERRQRRRICRRNNARCATEYGGYRTGTSNRHTYARYAQENSDEPVNVSDTKDTRAGQGSDTRLPIRKVCGVLSYDYYKNG